MYKVQRLAIRLGRLDLPTCFSIECQSASEANTLVLEGKCGGKSGVMEIPKPKTGADAITFDALVYWNSQLT